MNTFKTRLEEISRVNGRIILANDYDYITDQKNNTGKDIEKNITLKTIQNIKQLHPFICGIKLNFHLLLPLGKRQIMRINDTAHKYGLQCIADIKLNDISNTNQIAANHLWDMNFDAVIANPIMGPESLKKLVKTAHRNKRGVITLCHMSAPEARVSYDMTVRTTKQHLYELFLEWAVTSNVDGIIVGATFPDIIRYCAKNSKVDIFTPGVGVQGGDATVAVTSGARYLISGRSILNATNPIDVIKRLSTT